MLLALCLLALATVSVIFAARRRSWLIMIFAAFMLYAGIRALHDVLAEEPEKEVPVMRDR